MIIPAYRAGTTLPLVLRALEPQVAAEDREVLLIDSTGEAGEARQSVSWPWLREVHLPERVLPGRARNLGASLARGELLAFLDADAVPAADWLDQLTCAISPEIEMVVGAVLDGTPDDRWGTVAYMLEFLDWLPDQQRTPRYGASCNLLVRRSAFERAGGFPEDLWPGEDTVFSAPFGVSGTLLFTPDARVVHLNRVGRRAVLSHQRRLGAAWVEVCTRVPLRSSRLTRPSLVPVAIAMRVWITTRRLLGQPGGPRRVIKHGVRLIIGSLAWGVGAASASRARVGR